MAGRKRSKAERELLEARAKALRMQGVDMAAISEAVGVPPPTLYQWAARGKWRVSDLIEAQEHALPEPPPGLEPERDPGARGGGEADAVAAVPLEEVSPLDAAHRLLAQAANDAAAGQYVRSERAARLAERLFSMLDLAGLNDEDAAEIEENEDEDGDIDSDRVWARRLWENRLPPEMSIVEALEQLDPEDLPMPLFRFHLARRVCNAAVERSAERSGEREDDLNDLIGSLPDWLELQIERAIYRTPCPPVTEETIAHVLATAEPRSSADRDMPSPAERLADTRKR